MVEGHGFEPWNPKEQIYSLPRLTTSLSLQNKWCRLRESNPQPTDSYYYSFHYQFLVCSLDFLLAISFDLGPSYKVSTLGINLARDCHMSNTHLEFPELATSTLKVSQ